jgi:tetratricopeptide (TPR) repeat protein
MNARALRVVMLAVSLAALALPSSAWARPDGGANRAVTPSETQKAAALAKYEEGSKAFAQKRYKDAVDSFLEADATAQSPAFAYNIGLAYEGMGDDANALRWLREYLRRDPEAGDRDAVKPLIARHESRLAAKGIQQLTVLSEPAGATLLVDGRAVGVTPWTGELVPGPHTLQLQLRRYLDAEQSVELPASHADEVTVVLTQAPALGTAPTRAPASSRQLDHAPHDDADSGEGMLVMSAVALGLGAAGGAVAIGLEMTRRHAEDDARLAPTQIEAARHYERMSDRRTGARVAAGLGAGLAAAGVVMLVIGLSEASNDEAALDLDLQPLGLRLRGRF